MINYNPKNWFSIIFEFHKGESLRFMVTNMLLVGIYTSVIIVAYKEFFEERWTFKLGDDIHKMLGMVLGFVLVFRSNSAYERWWEGRKLLGSLVNNCRNLAIKLDAFLPEDDRVSRVAYAKAITNYVFAMKEHLRKGVLMDELEKEEFPIMDRLNQVQHVPNRIARYLYNRINHLFKRGIINGDQLRILDNQAAALTDIIGGCERIKKTPIPYSYNLYIKRFIFIYIVTLPWAFMANYGYWSIPAVMFVAFVLVGIELNAEEIEDPFGKDENDLPVDDIADTIKANVHEILVKSHFYQGEKEKAGK